MKKIKIFTGDTIPLVETEVNEFMNNKEIHIHKVFQSESIVGDSDRSYWNITITILYEERPIIDRAKIIN